MGSSNLSHMKTTTHFNLTLALTNSLSSLFPPPTTISFPPPSDDIYCQVCQSPFFFHLTNIKCSSVTYVTQDGICTAFSHPSLPSHMEPGNAPYAPRTTCYPRQQPDAYALLPPFSVSTLIERILQKKKTIRYR